jgi:hypothetical protein
VRALLIAELRCKETNLGEAYALQATVYTLMQIALSFLQTSHSVQLESDGTLQPVQCPVDDTVKIGPGLLHDHLAAGR